MTSVEKQQALPRRRSSLVTDEGITSEVLAAGALCWREKQGALEVLLIHRPRYDDWSFPKGKLDPGETVPECAVREIAEEIGVKVRLGIPLPITRYEIPKRTSNKTKEVWYWAAEIISGTPEPDGEETDKVQWVSPQKARKLLTNSGDSLPLDALEESFKTRRLRTVPLILLRHAKAKPRSSWSQLESERPLAATGKRQALAVERLLRAWRPRQLHTSSWKRCVETTAPYAKAHRHRIKYRKQLTEKRAQENPTKTRSRIVDILEQVQPSLMCSHRPVLPLILETLASWLSASELADALPQTDPYLRPGAIIVCQQALDAAGEIVSVEVYEPYDD